MKGEKPDYSIYENLAYISQIGIMMMVPIAGGVMFGRWLDERMGTNGQMLLVGVILGVIVAFLELFKLVAKLIEKQESKRRKIEEASKSQIEVLREEYLRLQKVVEDEEALVEADSTVVDADENQNSREADGGYHD